LKNNFAHICFDASVLKDGTLGIGIFDITHKKRLSFTFNVNSNKEFDALKGETMAMACALEYANKQGFNKIHLFTDNINVSNKGIPDRFIRKFPVLEFQISWIPRDLNKEADKLSKIASKITSKSTIKNIQERKITNVNKLFNKYPYKKRLEFLEKMAQRNDEKEFVRMIKSGVSGDYGFNPSSTKKFNKFIRLHNTIFDIAEHAEYPVKRIKRIRARFQHLSTNMSEHELFNEIQLRNIS